MAHPKVGFNDTPSDIRFLVHEYMCRDRKKSMTADRDSYMEVSSAAHLAMSIRQTRPARRIEFIYNLGTACLYVAQDGDAPKSTVLASFRQ